MRRICIKSLHGLYNYDYTIPEGQNVSVLTGPNGYGKTTLLNILSNLYQAHFWFFYYLVFEEIYVEFVGGPSVIVKKVVVSDNASVLDAGSLDSSYVHFEFSQGGVVLDSFDIKDSYIQSLVRKAKESAVLMRFGGNSPSAEWILSHQYSLENDVYIQNSARNLLLFLSSRNCLYVPSVRINTSFLFDRVNIGNSILNISEVLKRDFAEAQKVFAEVSQKSDATFFNRLMHLDKDRHIEQGEIDRLVTKLKNRVSDFRRYHLLPEEMSLLDPVGISDNLPVVSLYLQDMDKKLEALLPFYNRVLAFDSFVSGRILADKSMIIGPNGIEIVNSKEVRVPLEKLSDGEKNLIYIAYNLAYVSDRNTLVLIDEPENSLHMAWLEELLALFVSVAETHENQIFVATHSPAFINGNWDITYDLFDNNLDSVEYGTRRA